MVSDYDVKQAVKRHLSVEDYEDGYQSAVLPLLRPGRSHPRFLVLETCTAWPSGRVSVWSGKTPESLRLEMALGSFDADGLGTLMAGARDLARRLWGGWRS